MVKLLLFSLTCRDPDRVLRIPYDLRGPKIDISWMSSSRHEMSANIWYSCRVNFSIFFWMHLKREKLEFRISLSCGVGVCYTINLAMLDSKISNECCWVGEKLKLTHWNSHNCLYFLKYFPVYYTHTLLTAYIHTSICKYLPLRKEKQKSPPFRLISEICSRCFYKKGYLPP